jgi:hypothetical protein
VVDDPRSWLSATLSFPHELHAYLRYLEQAPAPRATEDYLFYETRVRFEPRVEDVLQLVDGTEAVTTPKGSALVHPPSGARVELPGLSIDAVERLISQIDAVRPLIEIEHCAKLPQGTLERFLLATFGTLVLAPSTIEHYQTRLDVLEIVRFPATPYEVTRNYWDNMSAVRMQLERTVRLAVDLETCWKHLRSLHVLALMGADGRSFYRPSSPITGKNVAPSALYHTDSKLLRTATTTWIVAGPRVSAPLVGGAPYHELLAHSVDDLAAVAAERTLVDESGIPWGELVVGRARGDAQAGSWFLPPRPIRDSHLQAVFHALANVEMPGTRQHREEALGSIADFHWYFIRLHPFSCANQSLAMCVVNCLLGRLGGVGIPHLVLDQLALRLDRLPYRRIFLRAVREFGVEAGSSMGRWKALREKRTLMEGFLRRVAETQDPRERALLPAQYPDEAAAALLVD